MTYSARRHLALFRALLVASLVVASQPASAQITTSTALPVHEGELIIRPQSTFRRATGDASGLNRELSVLALPTVAVYGATERLALFGIVPYLDKQLKLDTPSGRVTRGDSGLGDITFLARYSLWQDDHPGETFRFAPFVGLKTPTGEDDETDSIGRLPQPLQLGSGSWDPIIGSTFTWQTFDREFDASASYKFTTEANNFDFGDTARLDLSYQHRLWPQEFAGEGVPDFIYGVLETNLIWQDESELGGSSDPNSGGFKWFLAPGIQYISKRFIIEAAVQIPLFQNLNGNALEDDFIVTAGFRVNF